MTIIELTRNAGNRNVLENKKNDFQKPDLTLNNLLFWNCDRKRNILCVCVCVKYLIYRNRNVFENKKSETGSDIKQCVVLEL